MPRTVAALCLAIFVTSCSDLHGPPIPDALVAVRGSGQVGTVSEILPDSLVVRVEAEGRPARGVPVSWELSGTGWKGDLSAFRTPTDAAGEARVSWRLGPHARVQEVLARVDGLPPASFVAAARPGPMDSLLIEPDTLRISAIGDTARFQVTAVDAFGNVVPVPVRASWFPAYDDIVTVDITGRATALSDGETPVEARVGEAHGMAYVSVWPPVATLDLIPAAVNGLTDDTVRIFPVPRTGDGVVLTRRPVQWSSSDPAVAEVDSDGLVSLEGEGVAVVSALADEIRAELSVAVHIGSGLRVPDLAHFDSILPAIMEDHGLPGAAVAVARDGRLVLARGYGVEDRSTGRAVRPDALFRIASVSKAITATAVLGLVEEGSLALDTRVLPLLEGIGLAAPEADPRLGELTVQHLLTHSGGWDMEEAGFDPMFGARVIADRLEVPPPAGVDDIIRFMLGESLQFEPGSRFAYSNFGYAVLGRVIEAVTGVPYENHVRQRVLAPMGITRARIGHSREDGRVEGEVRYHGDGVSYSVFPPHDLVPEPYGSFYLEAMDAHGGWIASTVDLVRFGLSLDGKSTVPDALAPATLATMTRRPDLPDWAGTTRYYAMGLWVGDEGRWWWHDGSLPGTTAAVARSEDGRVVWAVVANGFVVPGTLIDALRSAVAATDHWPDHDLFPGAP